MGDPKILKKKITITFIVLIVLILGSSVLGWIFTQQIEKSNKIIDVVHQLKESELQLRREEKNLLIRGYSQQRYLRWQKAKEDFYQDFGQLIGMKALNDSEITKIKADYTQMSDVYSKFFEDIRAKSLTQAEIANYDTQFKNIGRATLEMINKIMVQEQKMSSSTDLRADILIIIFLLIFIATAGFLIVNVIKNL